MRRIALTVCVACGVTFSASASYAQGKGETFAADATSLVKMAKELAAELRDAPKPNTALNRRHEAFGKWIGVQGPEGLQAVKTLLADASPDVRAYGGELLVALAYGDRYQSYDASRPKTRTVVKTADLGEISGKLMKDADPFMAGFGEWAIAIRLGGEIEGRSDRQTNEALAWPAESSSAWYKQWVNQTPDDLLRDDFVRQAVAVNAHRSPKALARAADDLVRRAERLAVYIRPRVTAEQAKIADETVAKILAARAELDKIIAKSPQDAAAQRTQYLAVRKALRSMIRANPDINFTQIVFGLRRGEGGGGNITFGRGNSAPPGGDIYVKNGLSPASAAQPLIKGRLGPGHIKGLELWFDADRMVFAYVKQPGKRENHEQAHLFEMNIDGSNLHQITHGKFNTDQEPTYLPNGDIVFVSDRSFFGSQCAGSLDQDNMILNLYRCDRNGGNLRPISNNKDFDRHPHMMDNGQVLYLHWEYLDRDLWQTHTLWTTRPDGTMNDAIYKQHITSGPMSLRESRQIPGQQKLVGIGCGHHNSDIGAVIICDYSAGINEADGMKNVTPQVSSTEGGYGRGKPVTEGAVKDSGGYYRMPYPLSDKSFLVSYSHDERAGASNYGLYYIDVWGNKELIHRDLQSSVAFLSPLRRMPKPPILPEVAPVGNEKERFAKVYMHDVYADLPGVKPGAVKYLRIGQPVPWPCVKNESKNCGFSDLHYMSSTGWAPAFGMWGWGASRAIGIVPVEDDGSAYFKAPVDHPVFFQALDKDYTEVRRMRSYVTFFEGESRACVGCHESKPSAPPMTNMIGKAARRDPSRPVPPGFGDRVVPDFETHIQPILDRHCVSCHGEKNPDAGFDFTARKIHNYNQSYRTMFGLKPSDPTPATKSGFWQFWYPDQPLPCDESKTKNIFRDLYDNSFDGQLVTIASRKRGAEVSQPFEYGSSNSKLTKAVLDHKVKGLIKDMPQADWVALVTWVDLNAQYWGTFVFKDDYFAKKAKMCRRVQVVFPDPWQAPPMGEFFWANDDEIRVRPAPRPVGGAKTAQAD